MATIRMRKPIGRVRNQRFGGGSRGSQFAGTIGVDLSGLDRIEQQLAGPRMVEAVEKQLNRVLELSQTLVHVRTGELRDSGYVKVQSTGSKTSGEVGYTANHAAPEEFGAQGREPHPYLRPAWDEIVTSGDAREEIAEAVSQILVDIARGS